MSRSKKKSKISGIITTESEKRDKQNANRKFRRISKQKVQSGQENVPLVKETSIIWSFDKDGKIYHKDMTDKDLRK
jgi:hypothetical protein